MGLVKKWQIEKSNTLELANNLAEVKDGAITSDKLAFGTWELIADLSPSSQAVSITGLTDGEYMLYVKANTGCVLRINNDSGTNYDNARITWDRSSLSGTNMNSATSFPLINSGNGFTVAHIVKRSGDYTLMNWFSSYDATPGGNIKLMIFVGVHNSTSTLTSLDIPNTITGRVVLFKKS